MVTYLVGKKKIQSPSYHYLPYAVRSNLKKGIKLYKQGYAGMGLTSNTVAEARKMLLTGNVSESKLIKMRAWFARHDAAGYKRISNPPSPGYVAFLLWGGASGRTFAKRVLSK